MHPGVAADVAGILASLANLTVLSADHAIIRVVDRLYSLPRTGKAVRIDNWCLPLSKQSLADHLLALGKLADLFWDAAPAQCDPRSLAVMIAFHDLAEVLVGDVPDFTTADLAGAHFRTAEDKAEQERWANRRVLEALPADLRSEAEQALTLLADTTNEQTRFFHMLDKIEPIVAVWRYINHHRETLDINVFLEAMSDFFTNPKVIGTCINEETRELITQLQSTDAARAYFLGNKAPSMLGAILTEPMHYIE